jgi:hypothetical protein
MSVKIVNDVNYVLPILGVEALAQPNIMSQSSYYHRTDK